MTAEDKLTAAGVFKCVTGLRGLFDAQEFWDRQPYGTRLYYGTGTFDYLHRNVLRAALELLDGDGVVVADEFGLRKPVAWRREWDGDVSDEGHWMYADDEGDTKDGRAWQPLFLQPPTEEEIRAGLELFKRVTSGVEVKS